MKHSITFSSDASVTAFQVMAEGMWANYRDDDQEPEFSQVDRLMDLVHDATLGVTEFPVTVRLTPSVVEMAQSVLENALLVEPDDADLEEPTIKEGEVTIQ